MVLVSCLLVWLVWLFAGFLEVSCSCMFVVHILCGTTFHGVHAAIRHVAASVEGHCDKLHSNVWKATPVLHSGLQRLSQSASCSH